MINDHKISGPLKTCNREHYLSSKRLLLLVPLSVTSSIFYHAVAASSVSGASKSVSSTIIKCAILVRLNMWGTPMPTKAVTLIATFPFWMAVVHPTVLSANGVANGPTCSASTNIALSAFRRACAIAYAAFPIRRVFSKPSEVQMLRLSHTS